MSKTVYQIDRAGLYSNETEADESPLEPGVFLIPAGCVEPAPPATWPDDVWPRWNGAGWDLVRKPRSNAVVPDNETDPVLKLRAFLAANPDVAALLNTTDEAGNV